MIPLIQERMDTLGDFMPLCSFFFAREITPAIKDLVSEKSDEAVVAQILQTAIWALEKISPWNAEGVQIAVQQVGKYWQIPVRDVTRPLFTAIMGKPVGPPLYESIALLDLDLTRARLQSAMLLLGGLSKKKERNLEKAWHQALA